MRLRSIWAFALALVFAGGGNAWGWGSTGHKFVNRNAVIHLPSSMAALMAQQAFLEAHASDADNRKSADTAEAPKHFLDLESYPDYGQLPPDLAALINQYGWLVVKTNGILPWATIWTLDSMTAQLKRGDLGKAYQSAADLGHYVADSHQPLHCTVNYDGYQTGNNGIHSRYETKMIDAFQSSLSVAVDSVHYISDPYGYALSYILESNAYADSIMMADDSAKARSGWTGSGIAPQAYYDVLWEKTQHFTKLLLQESTVDLASLWYTAWVNAGLSGGAASIAEDNLPGGYVLEQNYPNPFNPLTAIKYTVGGVGGQGSGISVKLVIYDGLGREVAVLVNEKKAPGSYEVRFSGNGGSSSGGYGGGLSSGVYIYRLTAGSFVASRKMLLVK
jgi:hypothetical protein